MMKSDSEHLEVLFTCLSETLTHPIIHYFAVKCTFIDTDCLTGLDYPCVLQQSLKFRVGYYSNTLTLLTFVHRNSGTVMYFGRS